MLRLIVTLSAAIVLLPNAVVAQRNSYVLSPEYAGDFRNFAGHLQWGGDVKTFTARLDLRATHRFAPWVTAGLVVRDVACLEPCPDNGWLLLSGVRVDVADSEPVRPYLVAGVGAAVYNRETIDLLPTLGAGVRLTNRGGIVPRLETRWERYDGDGYVMLGLGLGLALGRPVNAYR